MANPTTNYGFVLPTASDLVTDLPADFDVALQGVDTRLKALQPGTTLGDLAYSSATANTNTRLGIGSTGNVLTVAGGVPTWAAPASSGGLTLLATATPSAASSFSFTSISGSYKHLQLVWRNFYWTASGNHATMKLNNDSGTNYSVDTIKSQGSAGATVSSDNGLNNLTSMMGSTDTNQAFLPGFTTNNNAPQVYSRGTMMIYNYTNGGLTNYEYTARAYDQANTRYNYVLGQGSYGASAAITQIDVTTSSSTFSGTCYLYGVN